LLPSFAVDFATKQPYGMWVINVPTSMTMSMGIPSDGLQTAEGKWTKRGVMAALGVDVEAVRFGVQSQANHLCLPKTVYTLQFVSEWLYFGTQPGLITDEKMEMENYPEWLDHRHDQSIYSLLVKKWGIPSWRDASHWGEKELGIHQLDDHRAGTGAYPQMFDYHKDKSRKKWRQP